jgi:predicted peptidase
MILSICSDPKILEIMRIVNLVINVIRIAVPIVLIFVLMIKLLGAVTKSDDDGLQKVMKIAPKNFLAAALVFLVPMIVRIVVHITAPDSEYEKCITITSVEEIDKIYEQRMEQLVSKAEETLNINDYNIAYNYLKYIRDKDKRQGYEERLEKVKSQIDNSGNPDSPNVPSGNNDYGKVNYDNFRWTPYKENTGPVAAYYSNVVDYAIWAPEDISDLNGVSLPLIVWLHGAGEMSYTISINDYVNTAFPKVIKEWRKYNLDPIPAIIVAPQSAGRWVKQSPVFEKNIESIKALIEYAKAKYNIDTNNIVLMGHSLGGNGVVYMSYEMQKRYSHDYFSKLVIMSGTESLKYPSNDIESGYNYFSKKDVRGYTDKYNLECEKFFIWIGKHENYKYYPSTSHGDIPRQALTEDLNGDGVSDLIYWLFGKNSSQVDDPGSGGGTSDKNGWNINKDYGTGEWVYHYRNYSELQKYYSRAIAFAEYVPEKTISSGDSLPLIIWLHGNGNVCGGDWSGLRYSQFVRDVYSWQKTGLKNIPAVIIAPQLYRPADYCPGWGAGEANDTIRALVKYAKEKYNINTNKVVLMGFSLGGTGVYRVSANNKNLFSAIVVMSSEQYPSKSNYDYYRNIPMRGYSEKWGDVGKAMRETFEKVGHSKDLTQYSLEEHPNISHGDIPELAFKEDKNNDKISDLIYWALSQNKK